MVRNLCVCHEPVYRTLSPVWGFGRPRTPRSLLIGGAPRTVAALRRAATVPHLSSGIDVYDKWDHGWAFDGLACDWLLLPG